MSIHDENKELQTILAHAPKKAAYRKGDRNPTPGYVDEDEFNMGKLVQWTTGDGLRFFPAGHTLKELPPGAYEPSYTPEKGYFMQRVHVKTEGLLQFPETNSERVINEIQKFWDRENLFTDYGLTHKRGIMLWGPPGSGKSCTIQLVMADVIVRGGVAIIFEEPNLYLENVRQFREIQPNTPLVVLMEDIDSILEVHNESEVLNILDGVEKIEKVVYLATTNYPEMLGERIINRPSRFDRRFKMPHPRSASRRLYFEHLLRGKEDKLAGIMDVEKWVKDTRGMSIAHLKELFVSVCILGDDYTETIKVLKSMMEGDDKPDSKDDREDKAGMGFNQNDSDFD